MRLGRLLAAAVMAGGCTPVALPPPPEDPSTLAGLKAGLACSAHFVAGRGLEAIVAEELRGLPPGADTLPDPVLDPKARTASVRFAAQLPPRVAFYREGFGCTTLPPGAAPADAARVPRLGGAARDLGAAIAWPDGDRMPDTPLPESIDRERLDALVASAFDGDTYGSGTRTVGIAIVHRGRLVAERYAPGFGPHTQSRSWSVAKSVTGALVGIAVGAGRLRVEDPAPIPEWRPGDPRGAIRVEDLLHMSSGLERAGSVSYPVYYGGADSIEAITSVPLEAEPGTRWHYSNRDTLLLVRALRAAIGDDAEYLAFPRSVLFDRIGMRSTVAEVDWRGNFVLSSQVFTTARDLARLGLLYLQDGVWNGQRILPDGWVEYTRRPAPGRATGLAALFRYGVAGLLGYGAQFWLLGGLPFVPDDAYGALGSRGQCVAIVPSESLVVVRTGLDPEPGDVLWRQDRFIADVVEAL